VASGHLHLAGSSGHSFSPPLAHGSATSLASGMMSPHPHPHAHAAHTMTMSHLGRGLGASPPLHPHHNFLAQVAQQAGLEAAGHPKHLHAHSHSHSSAPSHQPTANNTTLLASAHSAHSALSAVQMGSMQQPPPPPPGSGGPHTNDTFPRSYHTNTAASTTAAATGDTQQHGIGGAPQVSVYVYIFMDTVSLSPLSSPSSPSH